MLNADYEYADDVNNKQSGKELAGTKSFRQAEREVEFLHGLREKTQMLLEAIDAELEAIDRIHDN